MGAALVIASVCLLTPSAGRWAAQRAADNGPGGARTTLAEAPAELRAAAARAIEADRYRIEPSGPGGDPGTSNPSQGFTAAFSSRGLRVGLLADAGATWQVRLRSYGYPGHVVAAGAATPRALGQRVDYERAGITEWYVNGPTGLEQGFTLATPPPGRAGGAPLQVRLGVSGTLVPSLRAGAVLLANEGVPALRYSGLHAYDALGRELPSRLLLRGATVVLEVDDAEARFPLTIDPLLAGQEQQLFGTSAGDHFGASVALSGSTAVVGADQEDGGALSNVGAAYVFVRDGITWELEQELTPPTAGINGRFGGSVALDDDTVAVGAPGRNAVFVYTRSGTTWSLQQQVGPGLAGGDHFGTSVALDGTTLVVGADGEDSNVGAAHVFVRSGSTWTEQQEIASPSSPGQSRFGISVDVDGNTAIVGAYFEEAAYVFVRSGTTWTQQERLEASDTALLDWFGISVAVQGNTAMVGASQATGAEDQTGAVYVFGRVGGNWTELQKLSDPDGQTGDSFGDSIDIAGGGLLVGGPGVDAPGAAGAGAAFLFARDGSTWSQTQWFSSVDAEGGDGFGSAVALGEDAAFVGAPARDGVFGSLADVGLASAFAIVPELEQPGPSAQDHFGYSVATDGTIAVIGARSDDTTDGTDAGSAYVFERDGTRWMLRDTLTASDGGPFEYFGGSVAVDGATVFVGAEWVDVGGHPDAGAVYVFTRSGNDWTEQLKTFALDAADFAHFGSSVDIDGDWAAVGAKWADTAGGLQAGAVYVYRRIGGVWFEWQKLTAGDGTGDDELGIAVGLDAPTLVAGAHRDRTPGTDMGSAYVFEADEDGTWTEQQKLIQPLGGSFDFFGGSVSVSGDTAVVGASGINDGSIVGAGSAFVYVRAGGTWSLQQELSDPHPATDDHFGSSVALRDGVVVVGASHDDDAPAGADGGSAFVFVRSGATWTLETTLTAPDGVAGDRFGAAVALDDSIVVGAEFHDTAVDGAGVAYAFTPPPPPPVPTCKGQPATVYGIVGTAGADVIVGTSAAETIEGMGGNDLICGAGGADSLLGGAGADVLVGGPGNDRLGGGSGNDRLEGGPGVDTGAFPGGAPVTANLSTGSATGRGTDELATLENLIGGAGADVLTGSAAANRLEGLGGGDLLRGLAGRDAMVGGTGNDRCEGGGPVGTPGDSATSCETVTGVP
jgi:hypothetical protein